MLRTFREVTVCELGVQTQSADCVETCFTNRMESGVVRIQQPHRSNEE
jgi:hypothetical protein